MKFSRIILVTYSSSKCSWEKLILCDWEFHSCKSRINHERIFCVKFTTMNKKRKRSVLNIYDWEIHHHFQGHFTVVIEMFLTWLLIMTVTENASSTILARIILKDQNLENYTLSSYPFTIFESDVTINIHWGT
jgi:hypothetical protein